MVITLKPTQFFSSSISFRQRSNLLSKRSNIRASPPIKDRSLSIQVSEMLYLLPLLLQQNLLGSIIMAHSRMTRVFCPQSRSIVMFGDASTEEHHRDSKKSKATRPKRSEPPSPVQGPNSGPDNPFLKRTESSFTVRQTSAT
jgi:hypothetical protein